MYLWDKIYTIKNRKIYEYEITQIQKTTTKFWEETEYLISSTSWIFRRIDVGIEHIGDYFSTKDEAEKVLEIIKKYT